MKKKYVRKITLLILFVTIITISFYSYFYVKNAEKNSYSISQTIYVEDKNEELIVQEETNKNLIEQYQKENNNSDIKAILSIDNSNFLEPVAQTSNNEYYLTHNYQKNEDKLGAIYADYRVSLEKSRKKLIFGHSSTKNNTPFNYLENYYEESFYQQHKYIILQTKSNIYRYEIFSVYVETSDFTYMNMNFESDEDWYMHILKLQNKSLYSIDIDLDMNDEILIMQTCSNYSKYQKYKNKYLLVVSRRV